MDITFAFPYISIASHVLLPLLAVAIVARCAVALLRGKDEPTEWGALSFPGGLRMPLMHWENVIGRAASSDVAVKYPSLSRTHAAMIRGDDGRWRVFDLQSKGGVTLRGKRVPPDGALVKNGDIISFGGVDAVFLPKKDKPRAQEHAVRKPKKSGSLFTLALLTEFQLLLAVCAAIAKWDALTFHIPGAFAALTVITWIAYAVTKALRRNGFAVETLAFFLCTVGMGVTCSSAPTQALKQAALTAFGVAAYFALTFLLRDLSRAKRLRWLATAGGIALLAANLLFGGTIFGAKNWLVILGVSFQPSEFVKVCFVLAGAATADRLFTRQNLLLFLCFSGACVGALALMNDFGNALVFFVGYLIIAFLRSGDFATIFLSVAGAGFAGFLAFSVKPHIAARFRAWGHAWQDAYGAGFQQTRAMAAAAAGGLVGVGQGRGWLKTVFAADTDLVFAMVSEELGLLVALCCVAVLIVLAAYAVKSASNARSSFYVIAACAVCAIFVFQCALNVLGSVDLLPLTGVTFPFVSKGGSSLVACWIMLSFVTISQGVKLREKD